MKKTILVVDDEENMVHLLTTIFESAGYNVISALSGRDALEILKDNKPDLILLDIMMPEMDGWDVFRKIKKDNKTFSIPIIIITAKKDEIDKVMGVELLKVDGYVTKPFVRKELVDKIARTIDKDAK